MRKSKPSPSRNALNGTAVEMPAEPAYASADICALSPRHGEVIDGAQRARFGIQHQQPRLGPLHFAPLFRLQQVREVARQEGPVDGNLGEVHRGAIQPHVAVVRRRAGVHVEGVGQHVEHVALDFRARGFPSRGSLFDHHVGGFDRDRQQHAGGGLRPTPGCRHAIGAASARMPTRSPTRLSTLAIGISSSTIRPPITSVLPSSGGMNLRISGIVFSHGCRTTGSVVGAKWQCARCNCGEWWQRLRSRRSWPSPYSIWMARSPVVTRCSRWCCATSRAGRGGCCACCCVIPALLRFAFDRDRGILKQALLRATLRGATRDGARRVVAGIRARQDRAGLFS